MNQLTPKQPARRGRIFPELTLSPEELAKHEAEREVFHKRCRAIFERVRPELIKEHFHWSIAVEPDSGDYFIDKNKEVASQQAREKHHDAVHCMFRLNEIGAVGRI